MPPLVRSELVFSYEGNAAEAIVGDVVGAIVDAVARSAIAGGRRRATGAESAAEAWLAALVADDSRVDADEILMQAPRRALR